MEHANEHIRLLGWFLCWYTDVVQLISESPQTFNYYRACIAAVIFILCDFTFNSFVYHRLWNFIFAHAYNALPEVLFYVLENILSYGLYFLILALVIRFYFLRARVSMIHSFFLGVTFALFTFIETALANVFEMVLSRFGTYGVGMGNVPVFELFCIIIATVAITALLSHFKLLEE